MSGQPQKAHYPSVVFRVKGGLYCINSVYIETLCQLPAFETLPESPPVITGIFPYRDTFITMFDMRTAFGLEPLSGEFSAFSEMLDQRKEDHIRWVAELERCVAEGEAFTLSSDPHACAFGKWYDHFKSDRHAINTHMQKIDEPHKQLHLAAVEVEECRRIQDPALREEKLREVLERVRGKSMPEIIRLLDETKELFRSTMFQEMVLVLSDARFGLVVDEILMVDQLSPAEDQSGLSSLPCSPLLCGIMKSAKIPDVIFEVDVPRILQMMEVHVSGEGDGMDKLQQRELPAMATGVS